MKANVSQRESWLRVIDIEVPASELKIAFEKKVDEYRRKAKLPGFRPGKVPAAEITNRFGPAVRTEAVDELVQESYAQACREHMLQPVSQPSVKALSMEDGQPITCSIEVEVDPEIEISGYRNLRVRASPGKIKDSDVGKAVEDLRERLAEMRDLDRPSRKGDMVSLEYVEALVDGEPREDLKSPSQPIEVGAGRLKDFDKGLVGVQAGDTKEISIKFPRDYHVSDVAGKSAKLTIKVTEVQEKVLPEIDDDFLKKVGYFPDEEAMRAAIGRDLEQREKERAKNEAYNKAIDILIKNTRFEVPPSRIEYYLDRVVEEEARYHPAGKAPSREDVDGRFRESGIRALKRHRIIDYIATKEKIKSSQEEVDQRIRGIANQYGRPFEEVKRVLRKDGATSRIRDDIREQKTLESLIGELAWQE